MTIEHDVERGWCICGENHGAAPAKKPPQKRAPKTFYPLSIARPVPAKVEQAPWKPGDVCRHDWTKGGFTCHKICVRCGKTRKLQHVGEKCFHL